MKKNRLSIALLSGLLLFSSCDNWLEQENRMSFTENQAYTSETGINSIAANLYGRMKYWILVLTEILMTLLAGMRHLIIVSIGLLQEM